MEGVCCVCYQALIKNKLLFNLFFMRAEVFCCADDEADFH